MKVFAAISFTGAGAVMPNAASVGTPGNATDNVTVARTAAGVYELTLAPQGIDAAECLIVATVRGTYAASGLTAIAAAHTSDTVKVITCGQEGAAGAASAAADLACDVVIFSTRSRSAGGDGV